jgi:hypothetical protein
MGMHNMSGDEIPNIQNAILFKKNKFFDIPDHKKKLLYTNKLIKDRPEDVSHDFSKHGISYKFNKKNYRSPEFHEGTDVLFAGCSITRGDGIPEEFMWTNIVAKDLNLSHANLAQSGDSVSGQVKRIFAYIKEYGAPKYIYAIFPDFNRIQFPVNRRQFITGGALKQIKNGEKSHELWDEFFLQNAFIPDVIDESLKISIRPYIAEHVLTPEIGHFYSAQHILMLEEYCSLAKIKFAWSTWDQKQFNIIKSLGDEYYKTLIDLKLNKWHMDFDKVEDVYSENGSRVMCHEDIRSAGRTFFDLGRDREHGLVHAHWGSHRNQHVADIVKNHIKGWTNNG